MVYVERAMKTMHFTFWFTGNGLVPTTNNYCNFKATTVSSVNGDIFYSTWNVWNQRYTIESTLIIISLIPRLKFLTTSRLSIITLWIHDNCVYLIIPWWHYGKFAIGLRITILTVKQTDRKVWREVQYLVICSLSGENMVHLQKSHLL